MTNKEQTDAFSHELAALIDRYRSEFDLSYAQVIGTLHIHAAHLAHEGLSNDDDE